MLPEEDLLALADTGRTKDGTPFSDLPQITNPCTGDVSHYGPFGPRGWQDEYCEWSVERDSQGNILRIDFTCENPEYWNTLWAVDPNKVLELYRSTLGKRQIALEDLYLMAPSTGRPAYNPLNRWNSGPVSTASQGGAMHLTSTPNTLQTEIGLASAATVPRPVGNSNPQTLICCAQYGQPARNSDPHIGLSVNQLVAPPNPQRPSNKATLANPPGLYIQMPDFSGYQTRDQTNAAEFWTIVRGTSSPTDPDGRPMPGNYILHATFRVPPNKRYTVSDITINGQKIRWAGQVAQTFLMQITGMGLAQPSRAPVQNCVGVPSTELAQPLQLFHSSVFSALVGTHVPNFMGVPMNLASNSTLIAPTVRAGDTNVPMVLTALLPDVSALPTVTFDGGGITVQVQDMKSVDYAVPGNTYPGRVAALRILVSVQADARRAHGVCSSPVRGRRRHRRRSPQRCTSRPGRPPRACPCPCSRIALASRWRRCCLPLAVPGTGPPGKRLWGGPLPSRRRGLRLPPVRPPPALHRGSTVGASRFWSSARRCLRTSARWWARKTRTASPGSSSSR
ncbi:hypothetical protein [Myxococcus xanthus]|uniref:hypothetical protein n=1 Tax=Myxococcus xanthus TaxID=34 RepID=UPI0020A23512|nr:hypothetical protein [Myxococcus xanthus]